MDKRLELMEKGNMTKALFVLGFPAILSMMISSLYNLIDAIFIGRLGTDAVSAITIILPIVLIISAAASVFGMGAGSYLSRLLGMNKTDKANVVASIAFFSSFIIGICLVMVTYFFKTELLMYFGASGEVLKFAQDYAEIIFIGSFLTSVNIVTYNILRAEGNAIRPLYAVGGSTALNIVLNPIFMFVLGWGIKGAAAATLLAEIGAFVYLMAGFMKGKGVVKISFSYFTFSKDVYIEIIKIGSIGFIFQLMSGVGMTILNKVSIQYGPEMVAAMGIVGRILSLGFHIVFGFTMGFQPIAGYNYGASNYARTKEAVAKAFMYATVFSVGYGVIMGFGAEAIAGLFSDDQVVIAIVGNALMPNSIMFAFAGLQMVTITSFLAFGMAKEGGLLSLAKQGMFFIPMILVLPNYFGVEGIIYSQPLADLLTLLVVLIMVRKLFQKLQENFKEVAV